MTRGGVILALLALFCLASTAFAMPVGKTSSVECTSCHFIVGFIEGQLGNNKTVENIEATLDKVCGVLPSSLQSECTTLIGSYFQELVQIILKDESVDTACNQLGLCTSADNEAGKRFALATKNYVMAAQNPELVSSFCVTCEFAVSYADSELERNSTQEEIIQFVDNLCSILPATIRTDCDSFIAKYGPQFMDKLASDISPDKICTAIGACAPAPPPPTKKPAAAVKPVELMSGCSICEFVVAAAENIITNNSTESKIETDLDAACNILGKFASLCTGFVNQYLPIIFSDLVNGESPEIICSKIKVCPTSAPSAKPLFVAGKRPQF